MKYMGSKNRIAKYLLPIILKDRKPGQWYVEPFVGGANMIDKVGGNRIGGDFNSHLINALTLIRDNPFSIPMIITEDEYQKASERRKTQLDGFIGFAMSFGGKWFGGYRRDVKGSKGCLKNMETQTRRSRVSAIKQSNNLKSVELVSGSYSEIDIPDESIIYCDPPYANTTKYKDDFNHEEFWQWCRDMSNKGHQVFISEYNAPDDFECLWQKEIQSGLNTNTTKKGIEKLFKYHLNQ